MKNEYTLKSIIQKKITVRIVLLILTFSILLLATTAYNVYLQIMRVETKLTDPSASLDTYIISQELIKNRYAIGLKFKEIEENQPFHIHWFPSQTVFSGHVSGIIWHFPLSWKFYHIVKDNKTFYGYYNINGSLLSNKPFVTALVLKVILSAFF